MPWHFHRESHIPRPKLGLPYHYELPPGIEPFVHAGIVTLVQRAFCSCHHQNVVLLCAECAQISPEIRVESRCRRCFCLRQLFLILLVRSPEVCSQFGQPIRVLHRISVELVWLSDHPCVDHSCLHALSWRARLAVHLLCEPFSFVRVWSSPSLADVDVRSAAGWPLPSVPVLLESTWLFTHAVLPAVRTRFKYPRSIRAATEAANVLPRFLLTR